MKIKKLESKYLDDMAELFVAEYSEDAEGRKWDKAKAKEYLKRNVSEYPAYNLEALTDDGELMGAIFCGLRPYYTHNALSIDSIQIKEEYRNKGVGKGLFAAVLDIAKKNGIKKAHLLADGRTDFPKSWYERIGFRPTGWVEYEAEVDLDRF